MATQAKLSDDIFEEREEFIISPTGDSNPVLRKTYFLKPTLTSIRDKKSGFNNYCSVSTSFDVENCPIDVHFDGWRSPQFVWKSWVNSLRPIHESTWRKAGIYDAILSSTFGIRKYDDGLILAFAEKWCPESNTFVFPWGEATISLEDMMILGGFSVLGESAVNPFGFKNMSKPEDYEIKTRKNIKQSRWVKQFYECGNEFEHEAFLVLWLSRFVFTDRYDCIRNPLYPIASCLARGVKIALAPAVLASIYRDLSLLKASIVASSSGLYSMNDEDDDLSVKVNAPFQLVKVWIWERFLELRPEPNMIQLGEPIFAKWHNIKKLKTDGVKLVIDSAGNSFQWRPYNSGLHVQTNRERSVLVDSNLDEEAHSFARCVRVSELVGLDGIEQYLPHRVAMQFGINQDLPGHVARLNKTVEIAWANYTRPIYDVQYTPAQMFKAGVTTRYLEWQKPLLFDRRDPIKGIVFRRKRSSRYAMSLKRLKGDTRPNFLPVFSLNHKAGPVKFMDTPPPPPLGVTDFVVPGFRLHPKTHPFVHFKDIPSPPPGFMPNYKRVKLVRNSPNISWKAERLKVPTHQNQPSPSAVIGTEHEQDAEDMNRSVSSIQSRYSLLDGSTDVVVNGEAVRGSEGEEVDNGRVSVARCCVHEVKVLELVSRISMLEQELHSLKSVGKFYRKCSPQAFFYSDHFACQSSCNYLSTRWC